MKKFSDLRVDDSVWVVYNKNWDKSRPSEYYYYPSEYLLEECKVLKNDFKVPREIDRGDRWESDYVTIYEDIMSIMFHNMEYRRDYSDLYNDRGQMNCHPFKYGDNGPWIEIFSEKENAIEYLKAICDRDIKALDEKIEDCNHRKSLLIKSLENINETN